MHVIATMGRYSRRAFARRWPTLSLVVAVVALCQGPVAHARPPFPPKDYVVIAHRHGVTVYRRRHASLIDIGAYGRIPAPVKRVLAALLDFERHPGHIKRLAQSKILKRGKHTIIVYQRLDLPLISDRDFTLKTRWSCDTRGRCSIVYREDNSAGPPPRPGVVRVPFDRGGWDLVPCDGGRATLARYVTKMDLAGSLPRFLARSSAGSELPALFRAICRMAGPNAGSKCP